MTIFMLREFENLKRLILGLSAVVEEAVERAVRAVIQRDASLARQVVESDTEVDSREIEIEEECLKVLALHQPVASDLRYIVAVLKMNNDLERIGDLAASISRHAMRIAQLEGVRPPFDLHPMAVRIRSMIKQTLDALVNVDTERAAAVIAMDKEVDALNDAMAEQALDADHSNRTAAENVHRHLLIARSLERMGDHAKNLCEDIIYLAKGEIIRHTGDRTAPPTA